MIEQFLLGFLVPTKVSEIEAEAGRRVLASRAFQAQVLRAIRETVTSRPGLEKVVVALTR
jgi:hypothetical protein